MIAHPAPGIRVTCDDADMPVRAGAEPFAADRGDVGVLLVHGFTGSPASMRPWAQQVADAGYSVRVPRLPGHGTTWQEMQRTRWPDWYGEAERSYLDLRRQCRQVFVFGLSMGGTLSLRLAEEHTDVAGLVLVNPSLLSENKLLRLLPVLSRVVPSIPGVSNDIKLPGQDEIAYGRVPLQAMRSLTELWQVTRSELARVKAPLLLFRSATDHVVEPSNAALVLSSVASTQKSEVVLPDSYHVATLDNDAPTIVSRSLDFLAHQTGAEPSAERT
jgi:carboxylesterase